MPTYKLIYFDARARAEVSRILFALSGVDYEDVRIGRQQWPGLKSEMPFLQVPVLEVDGKVLCQSLVIEGYLAKQFGFDGDTEWNKTRVQMICTCLEEMRDVAASISHETDNERLEQRKAVYIKEQLPKFLRCIDNMLPQGGNYFVGNQMTVADIRFAVNMDTPMDNLGVVVPWQDFPRLHALRERVLAHPKIAAWIKLRPKTQR